MERLKAVDVLSSDEIESLTVSSNARGWLAIATTWFMIAASLAVVGIYPTWWSFLIAWLLIGGRFLALAILMHECAHYSLFKTRWLNDRCGQWLCGAPAWQDLRRYRKHHLAHHRFAGTENDPDISLVSHFPISRASLARKLARDVTGLSGVRRIYGLLLMDFGFIEYTVANNFKRIARVRSWREILHTGWVNLLPVLLAQVIVIGVLFAIGKPWLYGVWVFAYLSSFSFIVRVRSIAEHAVTGDGRDPLVNTRTTHASWLARVTFAPHRVNYHLEHHLLMTVPYFNLPRLHRLLDERGALAGAHRALSYSEVLRIATRHADH